MNITKVILRCKNTGKVFQREYISNEGCINPLKYTVCPCCGGDNYFIEKIVDSFDILKPLRVCETDNKLNAINEMEIIDIKGLQKEGYIFTLVDKINRTEYYLGLSIKGHIYILLEY